MYNLFTFNSTHHALFMEKVMIRANFEIKIIPVPRAISASCGLAARTNSSDYRKILDLIEKEEIDTDKVYLLDEKGEMKQIED